MERTTKQIWIGVSLTMLKKVEIGHVYEQMAKEKSKKQGKNLINYLNDLIAEDYQRKK